MSARILRGTKQEIAEKLAQITAQIYEVIVFVDEPLPPFSDARHCDSGDFFAEMEPYVAKCTSEVDDSREAIYTRLEGE